MGPFALFSNFKLTTSSRKHLEDFSHAQIVSLGYILLTLSRGRDDLSTGFDRSGDKRRNELASNKNLKGKYRLRIMLKDVFGFAKHQEKSTYGLGYKIILTRNKDDAVIDKAAIFVDTSFEKNHINWYVPHYTPSIQQRGILSKQILSKTPTELRYVERSIFLKELKNRNLWNFELGSHESMKIPIWMIIGFQQRDRQDSQNLNNDTFCSLPVTSAQCFIRTEKYPDAGKFPNYDDDEYSQAHGQIEEAFRALTKVDTLQVYISDHDFRSLNVRTDEVGYNLYVFDIRYQQTFTASQPNNVEFITDGVFPKDVSGYALVLTRKLGNISSDGERHFDLI